MEISNIEILKELKDRELLKQLMMAGIIPVKVVTHLEMYYHVTAQTTTGTKRGKAICETAACFDVTPRCVQRVVKSLS